VNEERHIACKELAKQWGNNIFVTLEHKRGIPIRRRGNVPALWAITSPRVLTVGFQLVNSDDLDKVLRLDEKLALDLGAQSCRIARYYGEVHVEIPLPEKYWTTIDAKGLNRKDGLWLALGKTARLTPIYCKLDGTTVAPILIAGRTGAGKTETLKLILWELVKQNTEKDLQIIIFDPKGKFDSVARLPHLVMPIVRESNNIANAIAWLLKQIQYRLDHQISNPKIVVFVDELIDLFYNDKNNAVGKGLGRISQLGRELGIHSILATQRPDRKYMDKLSAANLGLRLVGQTTDTTEAYVATGMGGVKTNLLSGQGDMLAVLCNRVHRMQAALVSQDDFEDLPKMEQDPAPIEICDLNILLDLVDNNKRKQPYTPKEIAYSLTDVGIINLKKNLHMGQARATRLRQEWAIPILDELGGLGYSVVQKGG